MKRGRAALSPREREVAALVAEGLTNREIGDRLVLTESTIKTYVSHILAAAGSPHRAAIGTWLANPDVYPLEPYRQIEDLRPLWRRARDEAGAAIATLGDLLADPERGSTGPWGRHAQAEAHLRQALLLLSREDERSRALSARSSASAD